MPTIRTASDRILATVAAIGKVKEGDYGPYQSILFEAPQLPDGKVWRSMNPEQAAAFTRGQQAYLVPTTNKAGKPSWDIELLGDTPPQPPPQPAAAATGGPTIPDDRKRAIASYISDLAPLYGYCYQQAHSQLEPHGASQDAVQAAASALFDSAVRRFSL